MKSLWNVALREIVERRLIWAAALLAGLLPLAAPWIPSLERHDPVELRSVAAGAMALVATLLLAPALGSSILGRALGERRLGFYFRHPLSGRALWLGKVAGAAVLIFGAQVLLLLPTVSVDGFGALLRWQGSSLWDAWGLEAAGALPALVVASLLLLLLGHAVGVVLRSRSAWLLVDLGVTAAAVAVGWSLSVPLLRIGAFEALAIGWGATLVGLLAALLLAGGEATAHGRTDPTRTHRFLSLVLWPAVAAILAGFAGWGTWVLHPLPADLARLERILEAPAGDWIALQGPVRGRPGDHEPLFLFDTAEGRFVHASATGWVMDLTFSRDGRRAAWSRLRVDRLGEGGELVLVDLTAPELTPVSTGIALAPGFQKLELSPSGDRLAVFEGERLSLLELPGGRLLASARLPEGSFGAYLSWLDADRVRVLASRRVEGSLEVEVDELGLEGNLRRIARVVPGESSFGWSLDATGSRMLHWAPGREPRVSDLETGGGQVELPVSAAGSWRSGIFLADGRVAMAEAVPDGAVVRVFNDEGEPEASFLLPGAGRLNVLGEAVPGVLELVGYLPGGARRGLLELAGPERRSARWWRLDGEVTPLPHDFWRRGAAVSPFLTTGDGGLLRLTPEMTWEVILPPGEEVPPPKLIGDLIPEGVGL